MRFGYASYEVRPSRTCPGGLLHRPEVAIDVIGPRHVATIQALVDTGSDDTVFPASLAHAIGVELDYSSTGRASAVGGHEVQLIPGSVMLQITDGQQRYHWPATIGFLEVQQPEDEVALLGYAGFLEFFRATFDGLAHELELVANARLPRATP